MGFKPKPREEEVEEVAQEEVKEVAREEVVDLASTNQELEETKLDLGDEASRLSTCTEYASIFHTPYFQVTPLNTYL